jgi:hypothetical protein
MAKQTFIVHLEEELARRVMAVVTSGTTGYASLDELLAVALLNQLNAEAAAGDARPAGPEIAQMPRRGMRLKNESDLSSLLMHPSENPPSALASEPMKSAEPLFVLTNRLSPVKIAARVLANIASRGLWPKTNVFYDNAARAARELGLKLRAEDDAAHRPREEKRATAYPTSDNEDRAFDRFKLAFTITPGALRPSGPMAILGLANFVDGDRVGLTEAGWELASAPSALLQEAMGATLSEEEQRILRRQIAQAPGERGAVTEFLRMARRANGAQGRLDELLSVQHPEWTPNLRTANRAALLGRLADLGILSVVGRGPEARVEILAPAAEFVSAA